MYSARSRLGPAAVCFFVDVEGGVTTGVTIGSGVTMGVTTSRVTTLGVISVTTLGGAALP